MIYSDEGDSGEWTPAELKRQWKAMNKERLRVIAENNKLKNDLKMWKTLAELWERTARRMKRRD